MSKLLRDAGEALYGPHWQSQIARDLGMSDRHMRRIVAGEADFSSGMALDLWRVAVGRAQAIDDVAKRLKEAGTHKNSA